MDVLKKNNFVVVIIGIILVYIGAYFYYVSPIYNHARNGIEASKRKINQSKKHLDKYIGKKPSAKNKKRRKSRRKRPKKVKKAKILPRIPSKELIDFHKKRKAKLKLAQESIENIYLSKSKSLKRAFKDLEGRQGDPVSVFLPVYDKEITLIVKKYTSAESVMEIGEEKTDSDFYEEDFPDKNQDIRKVLSFEDKKNIPRDGEEKRLEWIQNAQKKFWIVEHFLNIMTKSEMTSLSSFSVNNKKKNEKKDEMFEVFNVEATGKIYYKKIPMFIQEILNSKDLLTEIKKIDIRRNENYSVETIVVRVPHDDTLSKEERKNIAIEKEQKKRSKPETVIIKISCDVLNYIKPAQKEEKK